jgi:hypothetical protein
MAKRERHFVVEMISKLPAHYFAVFASGIKTRRLNNKYEPSLLTMPMNNTFEKFTPIKFIVVVGIKPLPTLKSHAHSPTAHSKFFCPPAHCPLPTP